MCIFRAITSSVASVFLLVSASVAFAQESDGDLAAKARDPTQPVTAFQIRYDFTTGFHNLPGADQQQLVLNPIIPWKWGDKLHIARLTLAGVTSGPDWGTLAGEAPAVVPPNYTPTLEKTGIGDLAAVDLMIMGTSWGRQGFGLGAIIPTASDPALGTEKWSLGPAYVAITKIGEVQAGFLGQWLFSVAGESDRDDLNSLTIQPFASYGLKNNWSISTSFMAFNYNVETSKWASLPLGFRVEKLINLGKLPARFFVEAEYNFADSGVAPDTTIRVALIPLF
jgi:hypothetical protein